MRFKCHSGIDLSESLLERAKEKAKEQGQEISFQLGDARNLNFATLNGLFPIFHSVKEFVNAGSEKGVSSKNTFDLMTFRDHSAYETEDDSGKKMSLKCNERYYIPAEITWLLKSVGFKKIDIAGAKLGAFSRKNKLTTEDFEMLVIAEK